MWKKTLFDVFLCLSPAHFSSCFCPILSKAMILRQSHYETSVSYINFVSIYFCHTFFPTVTAKRFVGYARTGWATFLHARAN